MKQVIILSGVSGAGKTHARLNAPVLKDLPYVDVADFYREFPELDGASATAAVCRKARQLLEAHDAIVIEGYYLPAWQSLQGDAAGRHGCSRGQSGVPRVLGAAGDLHRAHQRPVEAGTTHRNPTQCMR
jgi:hypothetical protein